MARAWQTRVRGARHSHSHHMPSIAPPKAAVFSCSCSTPGADVHVPLGLGCGSVSQHMLQVCLPPGAAHLGCHPHLRVGAVTIRQDLRQGLLQREGAPSSCCRDRCQKAGTHGAAGPRAGCPRGPVSLKRSPPSVLQTSCASCVVAEWGLVAQPFVRGSAPCLLQCKAAGGCRYQLWGLSHCVPAMPGAAPSAIQIHRDVFSAHIRRAVLWRTCCL
jgi:hypothetical protein